MGTRIGLKATRALSPQANSPTPSAPPLHQQEVRYAPKPFRFGIADAVGLRFRKML